MRPALLLAFVLGWAGSAAAADLDVAPPFAGPGFAGTGFAGPVIVAPAADVVIPPPDLPPLPFPVVPLPPVAAHAPAPVCNYLGHCVYPPPVDPAALGVPAYVLLPPPPPSPLGVVDYRNDYNQ